MGMRWVNVGWGAGIRWVREWGECVGGQVGLASWLVVVRAGMRWVREWGGCVGGQVRLASWLVVVRAGFWNSGCELERDVWV